MDLQLTNKHALITGGSKGIGLACAKGFLAEGARVTLVSRDRATLEAARTGLLGQFPAAKVHVVSADLKDAAAALAAIDDAEKALGPVDVLVNSAGAAKRTPPAELTPAHWRDAMDAKFFTYVNVTDPLVKRMAARGAGVATVTHMAGGSANAALMLMSAGLAAAYGPQGVRVNAVNPALTRTERMDEGLAADARLNNITKEQALAKSSARLPLGRLAEPGEIADAVLYLSSPCASYISGAIISMDGAATPMVV